MRAPLDRALFPQSLLRFLSTGERLGAAPHRVIDMFLAAFQVSGPLRGELAQLASRLQSGATLAAEAPRHPALFPAWLSTLFRFGQKSGRMQDALDWAAEELDREARTNRAVAVALAYPALLFTLILGLTLYCALFTSPQFRSIIMSMKSLPLGAAPFDRDWPIPAAASRLFVELGDWSGVLLTALLAWLAVMAIALFPKLWGHQRVHGAMRYLVPGVRTVDRHAREGLVARLLAAGLTAGLPLPELLDELADLPGQEDHRAILRNAAARIRMGASPPAAFERAEGGPAAPFALALATALSGPSAERVLERVAAVSGSRAADDLQRLPHSCGPLYTVALGLLCSFLPLAQFSVLFRFTSILMSY